MKFVFVVFVSLEQYNPLLSANSRVQPGQFLHIRNVEYTEQEQQERQLVWLSYDASTVAKMYDICNKSISQDRKMKKNGKESVICERNNTRKEYQKMRNIQEKRKKTRIEFFHLIEDTWIYFFVHKKKTRDQNSGKGFSIEGLNIEENSILSTG